jgi:hypothetical protein
MREGFVAAEEVQEDAAASNAAAATDMPAARTEPDLPEWPLTIPLMHKPLMKGNEEINELIFREPTAMDIIRRQSMPHRSGRAGWWSSHLQPGHRRCEDDARHGEPERLARTSTPENGPARL